MLVQLAEGIGSPSCSTGATAPGPWSGLGWALDELRRRGRQHEPAGGFSVPRSSSPRCQPPSPPSTGARHLADRASPPLHEQRRLRPDMGTGPAARRRRGVMLRTGRCGARVRSSGLAGGSPGLSLHALPTEIPRAEQRFAPHTAMTIFPWVCPCPWCRSASGTSLNS